MEAIAAVVGRIIDRVGARRREISDAVPLDGIGNDPGKSPAAEGGPAAAGSLVVGENIMQVPVTPGTGGDGRRQSHLLPAMGKSAIGDLQ
jgi:hypothetical protein